jgi:hypothetical protein
MEPKDLKNSEELKHTQETNENKIKENNEFQKPFINKDASGKEGRELSVNPEESGKKEKKKESLSGTEDFLKENKNESVSGEEKVSQKPEDKKSEAVELSLEDESQQEPVKESPEGKVNEEAESEVSESSENEETLKGVKKEDSEEKLPEEEQSVVSEVSEKEKIQQEAEKKTPEVKVSEEKNNNKAEEPSEEKEVEQKAEEEAPEEKLPEDKKSEAVELSKEDETQQKSEKGISEEKVHKEDKKDTGEPKENIKSLEEGEKNKPTKKPKKTSAVKVQVPKTHKKSTPKEKIETYDYSKYSQIELVNALRDLMDNEGDRDIKREVEAIRTTFYKKLKEENEQKKKQFVEEGGNEEDFNAEKNPYEKDIKELLKRYRQIRIEYNKKLEGEKELNLQLKYEVIEEIKGLIHKEESINKTFQEFRELQKRWREIGLVPQSKVKDLWDTYHFHVENFYDYIKINQELRDLDLKKNLEMKIRLCEQAEELLLEPNIIKAFHSLQKLHERWREIGPVPREHKDDIWERFKVSTTKINKKHQEYFENRKAQQKNNLEAKQALCEQVEEINELDIDDHKEWSEKSKEVINLQKVWRTIGFAPRKDNNKIYSRFRSACDKFFDAKREFYAQNKELQQNNLQLKIDLCVQAETLKDNTDWRKTTQDLINIQKQWKEIGPVPRKHSDSLWKRFRAACDYFFDKKSEHFSKIDEEQVENLNKKEKLIEDVKNFEPSDDVDENLNKMKEFQRRWTEIGHVPIKKKDVVQKEFREAINKLFDDLNIDESERNLLKFKTKMASFSESSNGQDRMRMEREKYVNKLKQHENDLVLLDNNIGFFAKSKKTELLIKDVKRKIEETKGKIEFLKEKIKVIDEMDRTED